MTLSGDLEGRTGGFNLLQTTFELTNITPVQRKTVAILPQDCFELHAGGVYTNVFLKSSLLTSAVSRALGTVV